MSKKQRSVGEMIRWWVAKRKGVLPLFQESQG